MPIYRIRIHADQPAQQEQELGFYQDRAAIEHARRIARGAPAEVWRDAQLVARLETTAGAPEPAL